MKRQTAKAIHTATNTAFWMENPDWRSGNRAFDVFNSAVRRLPFSVYEFEKRAFFDTSRLIAINGESVVVANGTDRVDKYMFRYPGKMALGEFCRGARFEVNAICTNLGFIALTTEVTIKNARIFHDPREGVLAVTQTQPRLDLNIHRNLDPDDLLEESSSPVHDRTLNDIEQLLQGAEHLVSENDFYPDIARGAGNLRRSVVDGAVTLIDVMPAYGNGRRLIGDRTPNNWIPHIKETLRKYEEIVGHAGG